VCFFAQADAGACSARTHPMAAAQPAFRSVKSFVS
jgi:hypothetical protein